MAVVVLSQHLCFTLPFYSFLAVVATSVAYALYKIDVVSFYIWQDLMESESIALYFYRDKSSRRIVTLRGFSKPSNQLSSLDQLSFPDAYYWNNIHVKKLEIWQELMEQNGLKRYISTGDMGE